MLTTRASAAGFPALKSSSRRSEDTGENSLLFAPHSGSGSRRAARMIVAEYVKGSVHHESEQLLSGADSLPPGVVASDFRANIHVAHDRSPPADAPQSKRNNVGGTVVSKVASIHRRDCPPTHEGNREQRVLDPIPTQRGRGGPANERSRHVQPTDARGNINRESARRTPHSVAPRDDLRRQNPRRRP